MISQNTLTIVYSCLGTLLVCSVIRDIKYYLYKNSYVTQYKYEVGERVICNNSQGKPVLCVILDQMYYVKDKSPCYRVRVHYSKNDVRVETVSERKIQCRESDFGSQYLN